MSVPLANGGYAPEVTDDLKTRMRELVDAGYKSTSRRYRIVVRIPPEFNGNVRRFERWCLDTYHETSGEKYKGRPLAKGMPARDVASFYCRVYSCYPFMKEHQMTLTIDEYAAFRAVGGKSW